MHVRRGLIAVWIAALVVAGVVFSSPGKTTVVHGASVSKAKTKCKTVTKHDQKKKVCVKVKVSAPKPTATPTDTPEPIAITSVTFYSAGSHTSCSPSGPSGTSFPNTVTEVYALAEISGWHGEHTIAVEAYSPDGNRASTTQTQATDIGVDCTWLPVSNTQWAQMPGTWTFRYYTDGNQVASATFTLTSVAPSPTPTSAARLQSTPCTYKPSAAAGSGATDHLTGINVCVQTTGPDGGSVNFARYLDSAGLAPPSGHVFLFAWLGERNLTGGGRYLSSEFSFEARGPSGDVYAGTRGAPYGQAGNEFGTVELDGSGDSQTGWAEFLIPAVAGDYTILWNESGAIPFTPIGTLPVAQSALLQPMRASVDARQMMR